MTGAVEKLWQTLFMADSLSETKIHRNYFRTPNNWKK